MAVLGPGECFGELAVLDGRPRSANAVAAQATRTLIVTRRDFVDWLSNRPRAALLLLETLSLRLRLTNEAFIDLAFFDLPHRLVRRLLRMAASDLKGRTGLDVKVSMTQSELASMLGVSRESVNKQLQAFSRRGWIAIGRGSVTIKSVEALRAFDALDVEG
jgi:CRP/FNR family cyclic AMP-dependent transcriptional regulator